MTLHLENITASYTPDSNILHDVTLTIPAGSFTTILGPSGSGKTTLLRVIAGLHRPDSGKILLGGKDITELKPEQRNIGLVPQDGALFGHLNVASNIAYGLPGVRTRRSALRHERVQELLELVDLGHLAERMPHQLSGGQQQRVALARALAPRPRLLLLDEPFSALDASLRGHVREEVAALLQRLGITTILITHDQTEALSLADHLVILRDGQSIQSGSPKLVYQQPIDSWVASFVGDANLLPVRTQGGGKVSTALGVFEVDAKMTAAQQLMLRPEQLQLRPVSEHLGAESAHQETGTIQQIQYFGHDQLVELTINNSEQTPMTARCSTVHPFQVGERASISVVGTPHFLLGTEQ